jgi:uncharacterized membrane protein YedE/YeeE
VGESANLAAVVTWGGLVLGLVFGAVAHRTNFCTMGALSDVVNMGHWGRLRMWVLAMVVAMLGTTVLHATGQIDIAASIYRRGTSLPLLSLVLGGLTFGIGMTLSGGCANKNLVRLGAGSLRSLVVLVVVGISGYMTLKGLFGQWRAGFLDPVAIDLGGAGLKDASVGGLLGAAGLGASAAGVAAAVLGLAGLAWVLKDKRFRGNGLQLVGGVVLGLLVVGGWYLTGHLGHGENPETLETVYFATNTRTLESMSFVAPVAFGLELLMLWTDQSLHLSFGTATAIGVALGALADAKASGKFRWEGFANVQDLKSQLAGAVLMGFGGVTALGCTVGQGMTGVSTLALGSFVALASIIAGGVGTLKYILWRAERE